MMNLNSPPQSCSLDACPPLEIRKRTAVCVCACYHYVDTAFWSQSYHVHIRCSHTHVYMLSKKLVKPSLSATPHPEIEHSFSVVKADALNPRDICRADL